MLTAAAVPQIFVYLPAGLFYLTAVWRMSARSWAGEKLAAGTYRDYLMTSGAGLALIFCGILLECYVNPHVLEAVLGIKKSYKKFTNKILTRCGRAKDRVSDMLLNTGKNPGNACIYRKNCV